MDYADYKELEEKYKDMDDEKWETLSDGEKKECIKYLSERSRRTSPYSPARREWKKEEEYELKDIPSEENSYLEEINEFRENLKPIENMIDKVYSSLINDELIYLEDFIPPIFLSEYASTKRSQWIIEEEKSVLVGLDMHFHEELFNFNSLTESVLFVMALMDDFIEKYPQYAQLIPDHDAFLQYGDKLIKEL